MALPMPLGSLEQPQKARFTTPHPNGIPFEGQPAAQNREREGGARLTGIIQLCDRV